MKIEKSFVVNARQQIVWNFITSPESVAPCIPGCENVEQLGPEKYKATIKIKIGPIKTKFNVEIMVEEENAPDFAAYLTQGSEGGKASRLSARSTLILKEISQTETKVLYTSDINLIGRLGKFSQGMMNKVADSIGDTFVESLRREVANIDEPADAVNENAKPVEQETTRSTSDWILTAGGIAAIVVLMLMII